ncbi:hypothetical protein [Agromyces sp. ZXT2-3]|uniref:hypothetical protein n=1 Tax=Agromyces sp. ZXT2-3 TaxID=3461152 RepID=UPI004054D5CC
MTAVSRGYLTLSHEMVRVEPMRFEVGGGEADVAVLGRIEDWSYYQPIVVRTVIGLDVEKAVANLRLPAGSRIDAILSWVSSGTSLRGASAPVPAGADTTLEVRIDAGLVREQLTVTVMLVTGSTPDVELYPLAPGNTGSVLWEETTKIDLEGIASRLPVVAQPFSQHLPDSTGAMWWLHIADENAALEVRADSVLWMWLNSDNPIIAEVLAGGQSHALERTTHHMWIDFHRQLVHFAIRRDDLDPEQEYPAGSLGELLRTVVHATGESPESLGHLYRSAPGDFEMRIQAAFGREVIA